MSGTRARIRGWGWLAQRVRRTSKPSALLLRLVARATSLWLRGWQRWVEQFRNWRAGRAAERAAPARMHFEALEPRLLLSADLNPSAQMVSPVSQAVVQTVPAAGDALKIDLGTVTDADGTAVKLDVKGRGTAQLIAQANGYVLQLRGTDARTTVSLQAKGGDGRVALVGIVATSAVGELNLTSADLSGLAEFGSSVGSLKLGAVRNATLHIGGSGQFELKADSLRDVQLLAPNADVAISADEFTATTPGASRIEVAGLRKLDLDGEMAADLKVSGRGIKGDVLDNVKIDGVIRAGVWSIDGRADSIATGSTSSAWRMNVHGPLNQLKIAGDASGTIAVASLDKFVVGGSTRNLTLLVGANLGADAALGGTGANADSFAAGKLSTLSVGGDMIASQVLISIDPVNGVFADGNDRQIGTATQRIDSLQVGGRLLDGSFIAAPAFPNRVKINGTPLRPGSVANLVSTPPDRVAPVLTASLLNDSGRSSSDGLSNDPSALIGITEAGTLASLSARFGTGSFQNLVFTRQADGSVLLTRTQLAALNGGTLPDGSYQLQLRATDAAGNTSQTVSLAFTLDSLAPTLTAFDLDAASDTGTPGDQSTTAAVVTLAGVAEAGADISLLRGSTSLGSTVAAGNGSFSFAGVALALGANSFSVVVSDAAGNSSSRDYSFTRTEVIGDTTAPTLTAALQSDTGRSASDGITRDATIAGQASDNVGVVQLRVALDPGTTPVFTDITASLQPDGSFVLTRAQLDTLAGGTLGQGAHTVRLVASDAAGLSTTREVSFTFDSLTPSRRNGNSHARTDHRAFGMPWRSHSTAACSGSSIWRCALRRNSSATSRSCSFGRRGH